MNPYSGISVYCYLIHLFSLSLPMSLLPILQGGSLNVAFCILQKSVRIRQPQVWTKFRRTLPCVYSTLCFFVKRSRHFCLRDISPLSLLPSIIYFCHSYIHLRLVGSRVSLAFPKSCEPVEPNTIPAPRYLDLSCLLCLSDYYLSLLAGCFHFKMLRGGEKQSYRLGPRVWVDQWET